MNLSHALEQGRAGLASAVQHTAEKSPEFDGIAKRFFWRYCTTHKEVFTEDVSNLYAGLNLPAPASQKAWGGITRHAMREGWISAEAVGTKRRTLGHGTYGPVWKSLVY